MTGQPWMAGPLGVPARIAIEAAFGADPFGNPATWTWTDITADVRHAQAAAATLGGKDNVPAATTAALSFALNNQNGDYTAFNPTGANYPNVALNTPIRRRVSLDNGATWATRWQGYADGWKPSVLDAAATRRIVTVNAIGKLGQLDGQNKPLRSPVVRALTKSAPTVMWPLESGPAADIGGVDLAALGPVTYGDQNMAAGIAGYADLTAGGYLTTRLPSTVTGPYRITCHVRVTDNPAGAFYAPVTLRGSDGTLWEMFFTAFPAAALHMAGDGVFGNSATGIIPTPQDGQWHAFTCIIEQNGADVRVRVYWDDVLASDTPAFTGGTYTLPARMTAAAVGAHWLTPATSLGVNNNLHVSGLAIRAGTNATYAAVPSLTGYVGELASDRLTRIAGEEGITLDLAGTSNIAMGPQAIDTTSNLFRSCAEADRGLLYDGLGPGVGYRCRSSMYNQTPTVFDMALTQVTPPFEPDFDRQNVGNVLTVDRKGGAAATVAVTTGQNGTAKIGNEPTSATVNVADDTYLQRIAAWLAGLGTVEGFRFPGLNADLRIVPAKAAALLAMKPGDLLRVANPRSKAVDLPPEAIDLLAVGWVETTTADTWVLAFNAAPGAPWRIFTINTDRVDAAASTLVAGITAGAASCQVTGPLPWDTTATPVDVVIAGQRNTVSSIVGSTPPQTFNFSARGVNGITKALPAGAEVHVADPAYVGM